MLSFNYGRKIAIFTDGKQKGKHIYLRGENSMNNEESDILVPQEEKADLISKQWYLKRNVKPSVREVIKKYINEGKKLKDVEEKYFDIYDDALNEVDYRLKNELNFTDKASEVPPPYVVW